MRRASRILGGAAATLGAAGGLLVWYASSLPWRNSCGTPLPPVTGEPTNAAVATSQPLATAAAAAMLRGGGTAADAAFAAALVLAVAEPGNSGLGGGGFALVHDPGDRRTTALDFREQAPIALDVAALAVAVKRDSQALRSGPLAVATPSEWEGLLELHRRFGTLPLEVLAAPAIAAARQGVAVGAEYCVRCLLRLATLRRHPETRRIFLTAAGLCPLPGWTLRQPELAATLEALAQGQPFDEVVGRRMVALLRGGGSAISDADLARPRVADRPVVQGTFKGHRIVSMGPPSSGGLIVISLLQSYERMRTLHPGANRQHLWIEASRLSFFDRARAYGDPDFGHGSMDRFASADYAQAQARRVGDAAPLALPATVPLATEGDHTSHLSIVDQHGLAVAMTITINVPFGSGLVVPGTGVLLNNEMDDFFVGGGNSYQLLGNDRNAPAPGKRPLSSMAPSMVFDGDRLQLVLGSPGGSGIPSAVAQVIRAMLEDGMTGEAAVRAGRIHHQWSPPVLEVEPYVDRAALPADLRAIARKPMVPIGRVQMVWRSPTGLRAVSDCRDQGAPFAAQLP
jgi:gamma-glutamyltranspeptidase/glutathione hydrolase